MPLWGSRRAQKKGSGKRQTLFHAFVRDEGLGVLDAIPFLCALGIVEAIEGTHKIACDTTDTLELDPCANAFCRVLGCRYRGFAVHQHRKHAPHYLKTKTCLPQIRKAPDCRAGFRAGKGPFVTDLKPGPWALVVSIGTPLRRFCSTGPVGPRKAFSDLTGADITVKFGSVNLPKKPCTQVHEQKKVATFPHGASPSDKF